MQLSYRQQLARQFSMQENIYDEFEYCCVVGTNVAEDIFFKIVNDFQISTILIHNQQGTQASVERLAEHYIDGLGNLEATLFVPQMGLAMSYDAFLDLGAIFFDARTVADVGRYGDLIGECRARVSSLVEYLSSRRPQSAAEISLWRDLKSYEDNHLLQAGIFL